MQKKRAAIARMYTKALTSIPGIDVPAVLSDRDTSWHLYVIQVNASKVRISRNEIINKLQRRGIQTSVHFIPLYRHPFYKKLLHSSNASFPNSERVYKRIISLPIYPAMTKKQVSRVIKAVEQIVTRKA